MDAGLLTGLSAPEMVVLLGAISLAGFVYGFAGFGAALLFMPIAVSILPPATAVGALAVSSLGSFATVVPQALKVADRRASGYLLGAALLAVPLGVWVLRTTDPVIMRWAVSLLVLSTLALLVTGWRYHQTPGPAAWIPVGGLIGFLGGSTGLNGPALVLFQLGGQQPAEVTRANSIVVLTLSGISLIPVMWAQGLLPLSTIVIGLVLLPFYAVSGYLGRRLFRPELAVLYRRVAYTIIGTAGLVGLPIWG